VVAAVGAVLRPWLRQHQQGWLTLPVYALGSLSVMWCIERGLEVF